MQPGRVRHEIHFSRATEVYWTLELINFDTGRKKRPEPNLKKTARGSRAESRSTLFVVAALAAKIMVPMPQTACSALTHGPDFPKCDRELFFFTPACDFFLRFVINILLNSHF